MDASGTVNVCSCQLEMPVCLWNGVIDRSRIGFVACITSSLMIPSQRQSSTAVFKHLVEVLNDCTVSVMPWLTIRLLHSVCQLQL
jgi:hypothetical protein